MKFFRERFLKTGHFDHSQRPKNRSRDHSRPGFPLCNRFLAAAEPHSRMPSITRKGNTCDGCIVDGSANYIEPHGAEAGCNICLDSTATPIQCGCACRGDSGLAHVECLIRKAHFQQVHRGSAAWRTCQTCMRDFTGPMQLALADAWWSRVCDLPHESSERIFVKAYLAICRCSGGRCDQALPMLLEAHADLRRLHGDDHAHTLQCAHHLAQAYSFSGQYKLAEQVEREVHRVSRQLLGEEHEATLESAEHLALVLVLEEAPQEAAVILRFVFGARNKNLGGEHLLTLRCKNHLARAYADQGDIAKAEQMVREVLHVQRRVLGPEHPESVASANNLATICQGGRIPGSRR
jgi:hypothetical protein